MEIALVSACLLGIECRYDGRSTPNAFLLERIRKGLLLPVPVCPEQLGGLPTPRAPNEIDRGDGEDVLAGRARVVDSDGLDRTENFLRGARQTLALAQLLSVKVAYLKQKSPSCGFGFIKRGGETVPGNGVTAALLLRHGIRVVPVD